MSEHDTYGQAGNWLIGAAKRNPEALLVFAAGAALFLRGRNAQAKASPSSSYSPSRSYYDDEFSRQPTAGGSGPLSRATEGASRLAESAKDYASDVTERISSTAGPYASAVSKFAEDTRQTVTSQASRFTNQAQSTVQQGFAQVLREQPLALAGVGLAAGAMLAAMFPSTDVEEQAFGPAREALMSAANQVGDNVKSAAGEAGEQLKQAVADKGLNADALKGLAREVAGNFANNVAGKDEERSPGLVPEGAGSGGTVPGRGGVR
jgi:hypothetical protein